MLSQRNGKPKIRQNFESHIPPKGEFGRTHWHSRWNAARVEIGAEILLRTNNSPSRKCLRSSPTHLARVFRSFLGCTPGDLLRASRLEKAGELLLLTDISLAEVALESGYSDQAQFTKAFRQMYGTPPGSYRRLSARRTPVRRNVAV